MCEQASGDAANLRLRRLVHAAPVFVEDIVDAPDRGLAGQNLSADVGEDVT